jgi:hypothetical protein
MLAQREGDVIGGVHRIEQRAHLEQEANLHPRFHQLPFRQVVDALAAEQHLPAVGPQQTDDVLQQHALARPAGANYHQRRAVFHLQRNVIQNHQPAEAFAQVSKFDEGFAGRSP